MATSGEETQPVSHEEATAEPTLTGEESDLGEQFGYADSFVEAMMAFTQRLERPLPWNKWRTAAASIADKYDDIPPRREVGRWSDIRKTCNAEVFGPDWPSLVQDAGAAARRDRLAAAASERESQAAASGASVGALELPGEALGGDGVALGPDGALQVESPGMAQRYAGLPPAQPEVVQLTSGAPSALPEVALIGSSYVSPQVFQLVHKHEPGGSETSSNFEARISAMRTEAEATGIAPELIDFVELGEGWKRILLRNWMEDSEGGQQAGVEMEAWATRKLAEGLPYQYPQEHEKQAVLVGLAYWAGLAPETTLAALDQLKAVLSVERVSSGPRTTPSQSVAGAGVGGVGVVLGGGGAASTPLRSSSSRLPITPEQQQTGAVPPDATVGMGTPPQVGGFSSEAAALFAMMQQNQGEWMRGLQENQNALVQALGSAAGQRPSSPERDAQGSYSSSLFSGIEFKKTLPQIKDSDTDFKRHWDNFQNLIDCHSFGKKVPRPYEVLMLLAGTFPANSVRLRIYNTQVDRARKKGRLPHDAAAVLEEIKQRLKQAIRETNFQRQERVDKEFEKLEQGNRVFSEFLSLWEEKLEDMEDAEITIVRDPKTLYRKFVGKLTYDLRSAILGRPWPLDGEDKPGRKPETWEEVVEAVQLELNNRVDSKAPTDGGGKVEHMKTLGVERPSPGSSESGLRRCKHCMRPGHFPEQCPWKPLAFMAIMKTVSASMS